MSEGQKFEGWAVVEMLGHRKLAGQVSEQVLAGAALIRVEVPETTEERVLEFGRRTTVVKPGYVKLIGVGSIYCITPTTEDVGRRCAQELERYNHPLPVTLPHLIAATASIDESDAELVDPDEGDDDDDEPNLGL